MPQSKYAAEIMPERVWPHMYNLFYSSGYSTKLSAHSNKPYEDPYSHFSLAGALQYLTFLYFMLYNKFVYLCIVQWHLICTYFVAYYGISRALHFMVFIFIHLLPSMLIKYVCEVSKWILDSLYLTSVGCFTKICSY